MNFNQFILIVLFVLASFSNSKSQIDGVILLEGKPKKEFDFNFINGFIVIDVFINCFYPLNLYS